MGQGKGKGATTDAALKDAATGLPAGQYKATIEGKVATGQGPQPNPIGDYRATLKPA